MKQLASIGTADPTEPYTNRPTVKAIVRMGNKILLLNDGLLPGGGVDENETLREALHRELQEELGAVVKNIKELGSVEQFRSFLKKRYIIYGFTADIVEFNDATDPQDDGEAHFSVRWVTIAEALQILKSSINAAEHDAATIDDDSAQGKLYNLKTTLALLNSLA